MMKTPNSRQRGVAIIEFALILPLLLILTFITTEFGRALYQYNTIAKSVRDAVRYLSTQDPSIKTSDAPKIEIARSLVVYGIPDGRATDLPLAPGLSLSQVPSSNISWKITGIDPAINTVTITVSGYKFRPLITKAFDLSFADSNGEIAFGPISATMRSQL